jgi:hypothetical protein
MTSTPAGRVLARSSRLTYAGRNANVRRPYVLAAQCRVEPRRSAPGCSCPCAWSSTTWTRSSPSWTSPRAPSSARPAQPSTTIGQFRVDAGEQAGAQQQILDLVWLALASRRSGTPRPCGCCRRTPRRIAPGRGGQPAEVSLDGGIRIHAALPTERLRRIQVVEIADDQNEA